MSADGEEIFTINGKIEDLTTDLPSVQAMLTVAGHESSEGNFARAAELYIQAAEKSPDDANTLNSCSWSLLIMNDEEHRHPVKALEFARKAVKLTSEKDPFSMDTLAYALFQTGNLEKAVMVQEKAVKMVPDEEDFKDRLEQYRMALEGDKRTVNK